MVHRLWKFSPNLIWNETEFACIWIDLHNHWPLKYRNKQLQKPYRDKKDYNLDERTFNSILLHVISMLNSSANIIRCTSVKWLTCSNLELPSANIILLHYINYRSVVTFGTVSEASIGHNYESYVDIGNYKRFGNWLWHWWWWRLITCNTCLF